MKIITQFTSLSLILATLCGCAATHTSISKRNLDVQTKMSETIFLDPVSPQQKTVFIQIRNTSGNNQLDIESQLARNLSNKGYTIVYDPKVAHYLIQTNVLQVGKVDLKESQDLLSEGFGGGLLGAGATAALGGNGRAALGVGLVGAAVGVVTNAMVKDNFYTIVTDLQISERTKEGTAVTETLYANLKQGTDANKTVSSTEQTDWKRYQTRVVSTANKVNLELEEAIPDLVAGLSNSISGLL
ncbi:complement resistance protein TraT [Candidatus Berkiella cookevillensis]|uniref:Complement resistance protein TraT n=1 Tax=Candidatus Berkiella cookevillensis TaxID=437022 RepID=A0A0Q9Y9P9_9GAMM|nr:complement resistance protein TraT [Candidatus Berkiella cookevillensis]MCS5709779.1 complement resistance protein TraT [Candidatus Berkiella cookevillensis]